MLGAAEIGPESQFRYDNSKPIGKSVANNPAHALNVPELISHLPYDTNTISDKSKGSLIDLWEAVCEQIQTKLKNESDDGIFRLLIPSFQLFLGVAPTRAQQTAVIRFMRNLKTLVRATNCVCLISLDESLLPDFVMANLTS
jgi:hypothetical protein